MTILFDAPKMTKKGGHIFLNLCQRLDEPITEALLHGASAMEEDEFSELDLGPLFMPEKRNRTEKRVLRFKAGYRRRYPVFFAGGVF